MRTCFLPENFLICFITLLAFMPGKLFAVDASELSIPVEVDYDASEPSFSFSTNRELTGENNVTISRKRPGENSWNELASVEDLDENAYVDNNVEIGEKYEYRFQKQVNSEYTAESYITAGIEIPPRFHRGAALVIVESSIQAPLFSAVERFKLDLAGDGWTTYSTTASSEDSVPEIKEIISDYYQQSDSTLESVILVGNIPVPYSGEIAPDGHNPDHLGAWPADVYYADHQGEWTDETVNNTSADREANHNVPGDGKFDQGRVPGVAEFQIGRIDLSDLPAFDKTEDELLNQYFDKNHDYRHVNFNVARKGVMDENFSSRGLPLPGSTAWKNFDAMTGRDNIIEGNFFEDLKDTNYLLAYGSGPGTYTSATDVGNTQDFTEKKPNAIFSMLFGSYFGDWDNEDNFLRAPLASEGNILTSAWVGRGHWTLHPMTLGATIGQCLTKTQNNRTLYGPAAFDFFGYNGGIFLSLHGDPTLRLHQVAPPDGFNASFEEPEQKVLLTWEASPDSDVIGYHLFKTQSLQEPFERITEEPINQTGYFDNDLTVGGFYYMVRAVKYEETPSGSYYNLSQGIIDQTNIDNVNHLSQSKIQEIHIFPNPASEKLNISIEKPEKLKLTISSLTGKTLIEKAESMKSDEHSINIGRLEEGIYFLQIEDKNGNTLKQSRFIKK